MRRARPGSAFWAVDPAAYAPTRYVPLRSPAYWLGAMFVGPREVLALERRVDPGQIRLSWGFPLVVTGLTTAQSSGLQGQLSPGSLGQLGQLGLNPPVKVALSAGLGGFLTAFARERDAVSGVFGPLVVSLAALGIVLVVLGALLLAEQRRGEFELMRARGAARWQLSATALLPGAGRDPSRRRRAAVAVASPPAPPRPAVVAGRGDPGRRPGRAAADRRGPAAVASTAAQPGGRTASAARRSGGWSSRRR